jgi:hypothetical protein
LKLHKSSLALISNAELSGVAHERARLRQQPRMLEAATPAIVVDHG